MPESVHSASWVGDTVEEFKKLPTWAKFAVGGVGILVAYLGFRAYQANKAGNANSQATGLQPTSNPAGAQSVFPSVSSLSPGGASEFPLLPSGVNPVFDPQGNLIGYQQTAGGTSATPPGQVGSTPNNPVTSPSPTQSSTGSSSNPVTQFFARQRMGSSSSAGIGIRSAPGGANATTTGNIPYGSPVQITGPAVQGGPNNAVTKGVAQSNLWYPVQGGYVSAADVTSSSSNSNSSSSPSVVKQQNTKTQTASSGAGAQSWESFMRGLGKPRTYVPQMGDNMNEVATKLGLRGGWRAFGTDNFQHGVPIAIPTMPAMSNMPSMPAIPSIQGMPGMPNIQQNSQGQSVSMPGISVHQSASGQSVQVNDLQVRQ